MSEDKHFENDPERTLITLEQLSQTIEVMTSVVNRLRQHLSDQLHAQMEEQQEQKKVEGAVASASDEESLAKDEDSTASKADPVSLEEGAPTEKTEKQKQSFVVEIRQQDDNPVRKNGKILH